MRNIKQIHTPHYSPIRELVTYGVLPTHTLDYLDPFLFLNHHGHQVYPKNNQGLPFGPHPHRGMETVTFILDGDIKHQDSTGHSSVIRSGGVQWMTAGKGLIHAETSSAEFMKEGGSLEILQLWINLPASHKLMEPRYLGLEKDDIPTVTHPGVRVQVLSGTVEGLTGPFESVTGVTFTTIACQKGYTYSLDIPAEHTIFFYVVRGRVRLNNRSVVLRSLVEFDYQEGSVEFEAEEDSYILLGHAKPLNEPVVSQGPFVMNTEEEIYQAYSDYQRGLFGKWSF